METLNVVLKLNQIICHEEGDGAGSAEPYLWAIFFKIDGLSVWQNGASLGGEAEFRFSHGSHENLPNHDVDPGEVIQIPSSVGEWSTLVKPILIDDFQGNIIEVPGIVGVIAVLMEEDNVSDSGAEAGHQGLNNHVKNSINNFISSISLLDFLNSTDPQADLQQMIADLIKSIEDGIEDVVKDAITSNQNWLEDIWAWVNKDDKIGDKVWTFNAQEIIDAGYHIPLNERWKNEGDWEINGDISASEVCPAEAMDRLSDRILNLRLDMAKLRKFRSTLYRKFPGAENWWMIAVKNSPFVMRELQNDKKLHQDFHTLIKMVENSVDDNDNLSDEFYNKATHVLERFTKSKFKSLRMDSKRMTPVLEKIKGKNLNDTLKVLSSDKSFG
jgi:hypothetical protein